MADGKSLAERIAEQTEAEHASLGSLGRFVHDLPPEDLAPAILKLAELIASTNGQRRVRVIAMMGNAAKRVLFEHHGIERDYDFPL